MTWLGPIRAPPHKNLTCPPCLLLYPRAASHGHSPGLAAVPPTTLVPAGLLLPVPCFPHCRDIRGAGFGVVVVVVVVLLKMGQQTYGNRWPYLQTEERSRARAWSDIGRLRRRRRFGQARRDTQAPSDPEGVSQLNSWTTGKLRTIGNRRRRIPGKFILKCSTSYDLCTFHQVQVEAIV